MVLKLLVSQTKMIWYRTAHTAVPTQQSVKAYVDAQLTAQ